MATSQSNLPLSNSSLPVEFPDCCSRMMSQPCSPSTLAFVDCHQWAIVHLVGSPYAPLQVWGQSVETLWRILMMFKDVSELWGVVTSRMLVWRAISGTADGVTEWTRAQVICSMAWRWVT
ncbi:hypothetical protein H2248_002228 [Termitomyces sp. 'cryptogamus']|nr:hypothetical protein H2248_002228 [Termitomyces sp. 'cryptogamus']